MMHPANILSIIAEVKRAIKQTQNIRKAVAFVTNQNGYGVKFPSNANLYISKGKLHLTQDGQNVFQINCSNTTQVVQDLIEIEATYGMTPR